VDTELLRRASGGGAGGGSAYSAGAVSPDEAATAVLARIEELTPELSGAWLAADGETLA
jgi:Asp-tRNA(Asn)/Glu-tRNA(Gln) amidotransferase A subunit family amidase